MAGVEAITAALSNVDVFRTVLLCAVTARPTTTELDMLMVSLQTVVQVEPSVDEYAVKVLPARTTRTHLGAGPAPPAVFVLIPPVAVRRWKARPFADERSMKACLEFAAKLSRNITPALAHGSVFPMVATRALISPFPLRV